ncbi:hypothetical protein AO715_05790 [Xanthomonas sp. Mitacek01]|nr:hypothetical protein AO715_05790 [Xanthomonas sp. Mitacek01]
MFINCKHCGSLVATDPATDQPPERCPRCRGVLRSGAPPQVSVASLLKAPVPEDAPVVVEATPVAALDSDVPATSHPAPTPPSEAVVEPPAPPSGAAVAAPVAPAAAEDTIVDEVHPPVREAAATQKPAALRTSPSFARRGAAVPRDARARRQQRLLSVAVVVLTAVLGLQILLADRARLAADPAWRPTLVRLCGALRCSLPAWREPTALTVLARDVRPDRARPGQLSASATFRNDARWAQAWPRLRLTLSDIDGRAVGSRVFTVEEYLGGPPPAPVLAAGHSADVRMQLVEADTRAVSFAFDFL